MPLRTYLCTILLTLVSVTPAAVVAAAGDCPTFSARVQVIGDGRAGRDALGALQASGLASDDDLWLEGTAADGVAVSIRGRDDRQPRVAKVLQHGIDFSCEGGRLVFSKPVESSREIDGEWYEGQSNVRIAPSPGVGLTIDIEFTGRRRATLYSYESARISLPLPGTRRTVSESLQWPTRPAPMAMPAEPSPPKESRVVEQVRKTLSSETLGAVQLAGLKDRGEAALATLKAPRSDDAIAFEDRLRAAAIPYRTKVSPIWADRSYHMELLIWPKDSAAAQPSRPSAFRVQEEMRQMRQPDVEVESVRDDGEAYVASVNLLGKASVADYVANLQRSSTMFGEVIVVRERAHPQYPKLRVATVRLRLR